MNPKSTSLLIHPSNFDDLQCRIILPQRWLDVIKLPATFWLSTLVKEYWGTEDSTIALKSSVLLADLHLTPEKNQFLLSSDCGSTSTQKRCVKQLTALGWIKRTRMDSESIKATLLNAKSGQSLRLYTNKKCEWCQGETLILHEHHFPVPKSRGGRESVNICGNCHAEYHAIEDWQIFQLTKKFEADNLALIGGAA